MQKRMKIITGILSATLLIGGGVIAYHNQIINSKSAVTTAAQTAAKTTNGELVLDTGTYKGEIKNGMANGHGIITYTNGDSWEGNFTNNKMDGKGIITYNLPNGEKNIKELDAAEIVTPPPFERVEYKGDSTPVPDDGYYHVDVNRPAGIYIYSITFHEGFRVPGMKAVDVHIMARSHNDENDLVQGRDEIVSITGSTGKVYDMTGTKRTGVNWNAEFKNYQEQEITQYQDVSVDEKSITSIVVRRDGKLITIKPDKETKYDTTHA